MHSRLGQVFYWLATGVAVLLILVAIAMAVAASPPDLAEYRIIAAMLAVTAVIVWVIGRLIYFVLTGR